MPRVAVPPWLRWLPARPVGPAPVPDPARPAPDGVVLPSDLPGDLPEGVRHLLVATHLHRQHSQRGPAHDHTLPGPRPDQPLRMGARARGALAQLDGDWVGLTFEGGDLVLDHAAVHARLARVDDPRRHVVSYRSTDLAWRDASGQARWVPGSWLELEAAAVRSGGVIVGVRAGWSRWQRHRALHLLEPRAPRPA